MQKLTKALKLSMVPLMAVTAIVGCSNDQTDLSDTQAFQNKQNGIEADGLPIARFQPSESVLPFPSNLLFAGTVDASLNIPGKVNSASSKAPAAAALSDPQVALNTMDGFSTTSPAIFTSSVAVDTTTLASNVHVYTPNAAVNNPAAGVIGGVQQSSKTVVAVGDKLIHGIDYVVSSSDGKTIAILPLRPLAPNATYYVVVTNGVKSSAGLALGADTEYVVAKSGDPLVSKADGSDCDFSDVSTCTVIKTTLVSELSSAISFEQVRLQTNTQEQAAVDFDAAATAPKKVDLTRDNIVLSFGFSTQNVGSALLQAKGITTAQMAPTAASGAAITVTSVPNVNPVDSLGIDVDGPGPTPSQPYADIYAATLNNIPQFVDPAQPDASFWKGDSTAWLDLTALGGDAGLKAACDGAFAGTDPSENLVPCNGYRPAKVADTSIPMLVSVPKLAAVNAVRAALNGGPDDCPANLPVTIYQHGITTSRGTLLAIADNLALQCQVVVAIDMPKHGITADDATFGSLQAQNAGLYASVAERLVSGKTSGETFINLPNLANSRDTFRQAVTDLHSLLVAVAPTIATGAATPTALTNAKIGVDIDQTKVSFVGMSLGGIVGMPFIAQQEGISAAVLNVTGGGIAKILDGSASFEPRITAGLAAAAGITKPSSDYETFLIAAQTMVDSADPINMYNQIVKPNSTGTTPGGTARAILMQEVAGTSTNLPDQTVPNNVFGLPPQEGGVGQAFATVYSKMGALSPATYNPANTTPGLLSGTDPISRGTAFVGIAGALAKATAENDAATLAALSPLVSNPNNINTLDTDGDGLVDANPALANAFLGMNLTQVSESGAATTPLALVRYSQGYHGSLLDPSSDSLANANVTTAMQIQMVGFIASVNGGGVANAAVPGTASNVPAGVINAP